MKNSGVNVLGTDPQNIDTAEDRHKFSSVLDRIGVDQPQWAEVTTVDAAKEFANTVGFVLNLWSPNHLSEFFYTDTLCSFDHRMFSPALQ